MRKKSSVEQTQNSLSKTAGSAVQKSHQISTVKPKAEVSAKKPSLSSVIIELNGRKARNSREG